MERRIEWVDIAKGIGIILVVYGHVLRGLHDAELGGLSENYFKLSDTLVYGFHMPLFFFLSGMFSAKWAQRDIATATRQKASSLLYPYAVWSIIQGLFMIAMSSFTNVGDGLSLGSLAQSILLSPFGQFWFLYVLFFVFMLYYAGKKVMSDRTLFLLSLVPFVLSPLFMDVWSFGKLAIHFTYFIVGALTFNKGIVEKVLKGKIGFGAASLSFVIVNAIYLRIYESLNEYALLLVQLAVALTGIAFILTLSHFLSRARVPVLSAFGGASVSIYLMHILAGSGTRIILSKFLHIDSIGIHLVAGVLVGLLAPMAVHVIAERIKYASYLFAFNSKKKSAAGA